MSEYKEYISIGFDLSYGDGDFRITSSISNLSVEKMNVLRAMIPVAIGEAERMFRSENEKRLISMAVQVTRKVQS